MDNKFIRAGEVAQELSVSKPYGLLYSTLIFSVCWLIRFRLSLLVHTENFVADPTAKPTANAEILIYFCCFHKITFLCQFCV